MIASNFKYPKGFEPSEFPDLDEDEDGPDIEEVSADDLD
jgi:hypothetical protein